MKAQVRLMSTGKPPTEADVQEMFSRLKALRERLLSLNDVRDRWTDAGVALACICLAGCPEEREFWANVDLADAR